MNSDMPILRVHETTSKTVNTISKFVSKPDAEDIHRIQTIIQHYERFIDYHQILDMILSHES